MFRGVYTVDVDKKGYLTLPDRIVNTDRLIDTKYSALSLFVLDDVIYCYYTVKFVKICERAVKVAIDTPIIRPFVRYILSSSYFVKIDETGQIKIPDVLLQRANINQRAVITGVLDHFEIYNLEEWEAEKKQLEEDIKGSDIEGFRDELKKLDL